MGNKLQGQIVIVTGAGRGIGQAMATGCAAEGAQVALAARSEAELRETAAVIAQEGGTALIVPTDVTDRDDVQQLISHTEKELGPVTLMVNNAGRLNSLGPLWEAEPDNWWADVTVNIWGLFLCCREVLPGMIRRGTGRIINMVGGGTRRPFPFASAYGCSKAAVMRLTETLAVELQEVGTAVKVFALTPGFVRTAMTEQFTRTEAGQKWMGDLADRLAEGEDVPPERAASMVVELGSGRLDALHGRFFHSAEDLEQLDSLPERAQSILREDLRALRMN